MPVGFVFDVDGPGPGTFRVAVGNVVPVDEAEGNTVGADDTELAEIATTGVTAPASAASATGGTTPVAEGAESPVAGRLFASGSVLEVPETRNTPTNPSTRAKAISAQIARRSGFGGGGATTST